VHLAPRRRMRIGKATSQAWPTEADLVNASGYSGPVSRWECFRKL